MHFKDIKSTKLSHLSKHYKEKLARWAKRCTKTDLTLIFTAECKATLVGSNGWLVDWLFHINNQSTRLII